MENRKWNENTYKSSANERARKSKRYFDWRIKVFERDNFTCQKCLNKKELHPHHIKEFAKYPELRFDVENGLTLCERCHGEIHGIDYKRNKKKLVCKNCGIKFPIKDGQYGHQFCSKRCGYDYRSKVPSSKKGKRYPHLDKYPIKECPSCGISFKAVVHISRNQKYCSHKCYLKKRWGYTGKEGVKCGE